MDSLGDAVVLTAETRRPHAQRRHGRIGRLVENGIIGQACAEQGPEGGQAGVFGARRLQAGEEYGFLRSNIRAFRKNSLGHATVPDVGMTQGLNQFNGAPLSQREARRPRRHGPTGLVSGPDNAPNAATLTIDTFRVGSGILIAGVLVVPVHHPHRAVGASLHAYRHEPPVVGPQKITIGRGKERAALRGQSIAMNSVVVNISLEGHAAELRRILIALINIHTGVRRHGVLVVDDTGEQVVGVGIGRLPCLALVETSRSEVKEMIDDAGADEGVAPGVEVDPPRIGRALGEDLHAPGLRLEAGHPRRQQHRFPRLGRIHGLGPGEHPVGHVHLAVGAPGEAIEELVPVFETKACLDDGLLVGDEIPVGVFEEIQVRSSPQIDAAIGYQNARSQREAFGEHLDRVGSAVAVGVFEHLDAVAPLLSRLCAQRILVKFHHPQSPPVVPSHGHGVHHFGLRSKEPCLKSWQQGEAFLGFFGAVGGIVSRLVLARQLPPRRGVGVHRKPKLRMPGHFGHQGKRRQENRGESENRQAGHGDEVK